MQVFRFHPRCCVFTQDIRVKGVTLRQLPHSVVGCGLRQYALEIIDQPLVRRINRAGDRRFNAGLEIRAFAVGQILDFGRAFLEGSGQHIFRRRFRDEIADFLEHLFDHETRRKNLFLFTQAQAFEQLIEFSRHGVQPHQVILAVLLFE